MAFMVPEYIQRRAYHIDGPQGIRPFFAEIVGEADKEFAAGNEDAAREFFADFLEEEIDDIWEVTRDEKPMWYCRLSAPGYMDCTEWSGGYETLEAARQAIVDMYEVDPDSGDNLEEEETA